MKKYIFIDRDGTIIEDANYLDSIDEVFFIDNVINVLRSLIKRNYNIVIVTNQSGIGRGYFSTEQFEKINNHIIKILKSNDVTIVDTLVCPHKPDDNCYCRKPRNGLFKKL